MAHGPTRLAAVIFDFDGLLADTEGLHRRAWLGILEARGVCISEADYCRHFIREGRSVADLLRARGVTCDVEALRAEKFAYHVARIADDLRPMPGAMDLLAALHGR